MIEEYNNNGLDQNILNQLHKIFDVYPQIIQVKLYGSRAKGTFQAYSDIDLAIYGESIDRFILGSLLVDLEDSDIIYKVDVQDYASIKNTELREHIDRVGIIIYLRK